MKSHCVESFLWKELLTCRKAVYILNGYQQEVWKQNPVLYVVMSANPIPVAAQSKACVCGRSIAGFVGYNPAGGMDVCLLWMLCVVRKRSPRRADHSSRGVLPSVVSECDHES